MPPRTLTALPELRQKVTGRADPDSDMLNVSSHTSHPQPKPRENRMLTVNDAPAPAMLTVNGV